MQTYFFSFALLLSMTPLTTMSMPTSPIAVGEDEKQQKNYISERDYAGDFPGSGYIPPVPNNAKVHDLTTAQDNSETNDQFFVQFLNDVKNNISSTEKRLSNGSNNNKKRLQQLEILKNITNMILDQYDL